jgi:hypothetical protein
LVTNSKRSTWFDQYHLYPHASKFHNTLRTFFTTDPYFKKLKCYQEVPLKALVESYPNSFDAVDWFIDELNTVIELHGKQHYEKVMFGKKSFYEAEQDFKNIQFRDNRKKTYLLEANYNFVEISYKEAKLLTPQYIKDKVFSIINSES